VTRSALLMGKPKYQRKPPICLKSPKNFIL